MKSVFVLMLVSLRIAFWQIADGVAVTSAVVTAASAPTHFGKSSCVAPKNSRTGVLKFVNTPFCRDESSSQEMKADGAFVVVPFSFEV